jgi:hypothetical protein
LASHVHLMLKSTLHHSIRIEDIVCLILIKILHTCEIKSSLIPSKLCSLKLYHIAFRRTCRAFSPWEACPMRRSPLPKGWLTNTNAVRWSRNSCRVELEISRRIMQWAISHIPEGGGGVSYPFILHESAHWPKKPLCYLISFFMNTNINKHYILKTFLLKLKLFPNSPSFKE